MKNSQINLSLGIKNDNLYDRNDSLLSQEFLKNKKTFSQNIYENIKPGISVGLLNLALCISIPVASECNPEQGILAGIVAGILSGFLSGSKFNIIGPSGTLSGIVSGLVLKYGMHSIPIFTFASGVISLIIKYFNFENEIDLIPVEVNEGFKLGVAFLLFYTQIFSAIGFIKPKGEENSFIVFFKNFGFHNILTFIIFLIFFLSLTYLIKNYPHIPWIIISAFLGIFLGFSGLPVATLKTKYGDLNMKLGNFSYMTESNPLILFDPFVWLETIPLSLVVVMETLVTAKIIDEMAGTKFNRGKELISVAIINMVAGLLGGLPISGTLGRATLNWRSGANHKLSNLVNSFVLLFFGLIFFSFFKYLPLCVVASQLCVIALLMINFPEMRKLFYENKKKLVYLILIGVLFIWRDPTQGVIFGMFVFYVEFQKKIIVPHSEFLTPCKLENFNDNLFSRQNLVNSFVEKDIIIYRIIGILNSLNVDLHSHKIFTFLSEKNNHLCICLRYTYLNSKDVYEQLKTLAETLKKKNVETFPILVVGRSKQEVVDYMGSDWLFNINKIGLSFIENNSN